MVTDDMFATEAVALKKNTELAASLRVKYRVNELPDGKLAGLLALTITARAKWYNALTAMYNEYVKGAADKDEAYWPEGMVKLYHGTVLFYGDKTDYVLFSNGAFTTKLEFDDKRRAEQQAREEQARDSCSCHGSYG